MRLFKFFIPTVLWSILIGYLCFTPGHKLPEYDIFTYDKLGHFGMFAILVFLGIWGGKMQRSNQLVLNKIVGVSFLFGVFYSGLIEVIQENMIPSRSGEWGDFLADFVGCVLGWVGYLVWKYFQQSKIKEEDI